MLGIRSVVFYVGLVLLTFVWATLSLLLGWAMPYRARFNFVITWWSRMVLGWLRWTCNVRHEVIGLEHVPAEPAVIMARHESTWESFFLQTLFVPQATLIKKELLNIPFWGWAFRMLRPIAIDRSQRHAAMKKLLREGANRLATGSWVVLFPEGTRKASGKLGRFAAGGAMLSQRTGRPLVVVYHNAAQCWPAHRYLKQPGTITVRIAPPIEPGDMDSKSLNALAEDTMASLAEQSGERSALPNGAAA